MTEKQTEDNKDNKVTTSPRPRDPRALEESSFSSLPPVKALAKIDIRNVVYFSRSSRLQRLVRSSQLVAIHILFVGNDNGNSPIPSNERESEFF